MSLPRYSEYKDSGVAWLAEIPAQWELKRLGYFFDERREKVSDKDFPALSVTKNGIVPQLETAAKTDDGDNRKKVCSGDFVINSRSDRKGSSGISSLDGSVSLINTVLRPRAEVVPGYVHQLLRSQSFQEEFYRFGKGIVADLWSTNYSEMSNITLALPSRQEQTAIAAFLDRETAKIDGLIAEQEKLITLLAEKRQATISHAVTKGLNTDTPMKDSGVVWLGEVPAHWNVAPLSIICSLIQTGPFGSQLHAEDYIEDGTPVVNPSNLVDGQIVPDWKCSVAAEMVNSLPQHVLRIGDIVFGRRGEMGRCALVKPDNAGWLCGTGSLNLRLKTGNPKFVVTYLGTPIVRELLKLESVGSTMDNLNAGILSRIRVPQPPDVEQAAIATFLETEISRLNALTAEATHGIALLKERRSALISAAVTGKIDVREANNQ